MQQIYRRTPMPKCDFHVDAKGYIQNLDSDPNIVNIVSMRLILLSFSVFYSFFILRKKQKCIYFLTLLFHTEPILDIFFFGAV